MEYFQQKAQDLAYDLESHQTEAAADLLRSEVHRDPGRTAGLIATANADVQRDASRQRAYPDADKAFIERDGAVVVQNSHDGHTAFAGNIPAMGGAITEVRPYYAMRPVMPVMPMVPIVPGINLVVPFGIGHRRGW